MKKLIIAVVFSTVSFLYAENMSEKSVMASQLVDAMAVFKNNLFRHETFGSLMSSLSEEVRNDFNTLVDDVWVFFCKVHSYCLEHLKNNPLMEKYKQFMHVDTIKGTVSFGLEDIEKLKRGLNSEHDENSLSALQSFYETLNEQEKIEFEALLKELCQFFDELEKEYEQMLASYSGLEEAVSEALPEDKTLYIECGLEAPFPSFIHYVE